MATEAQSGQPKRKGRPLKLSPVQVEQLLEITRQNSSASLDDLSWLFRRATGISLSSATVEKYLRRNGFARGPQKGRGVAKPPAPASEAKPKVYGYTDDHRDPGDSRRYPCGLTDSEWDQVRDLFDPPGRVGRPATHDRRLVLDACIYVLRSGCAWRMLPKDFPSWTLVYRTFRRWQSRDLFETMYDRLRNLWRTREHRLPEATGAVLDSQSVRTSQQGGPKGYDGAKKIKGRKRHLVTDTLGLLISVTVTTANVPDRAAASEVFGRAAAKEPTLAMLYVDSGYAGECAQEIRETCGVDVQVVRQEYKHWHEGQFSLFERTGGFQVLPKRWVIERTNAWNDRPRRMNKDHDRLLAVSTAWIWLADGRRLLRRLTSGE